jgi:nucleotide-binding universal stress UspA family protein
MMEVSKLKKRPAYPFETIAVAIAFSPRLEALLHEAKYYTESFKANLVLLHVGEKDPKKEEALDVLITNIGLPKSKTRTIWMDGEPTETILNLCKLNIVDLLILGALEKENLYKFYMGSIARKVSRRAKCTVLLITNPSVSVKQNKIKKIVLNGVDNPKTVHTINTSVYFAKALKIKELTVVQEIDMPAIALTIAENSTAPEASKIKKEMKDEEFAKINSIVEKIESNDLVINVKNVTGKPVYAISNYAKTKHYELLVINSPDTHLSIFDRIFTHDIEHILADLPCNLLIVHSRV